MFFPLAYPDDLLELPAYLVAILFFTPMAIGIGLMLYNKRFDRQWKSGLFPPKYKFTRDHLLEAYLALAALIIQMQQKEGRKKIVYVNEYFNRYFTENNYDFGDSLAFSFRYPVKIDSVTDWLKTHLTDEVERTHIIYFLIGVAMTEGKLSLRDKKFLALINQKLELSLEQLERILATYQSYQRHSQKKSKRRVVREDGRKDALLILGLDNSATADDIKKRYREMVKKHHPDRFADSGEEQLKIANEKFIEIQRAYEQLLPKREEV